MRTSGLAHSCTKFSEQPQVTSPVIPQELAFLFHFHRLVAIVPPGLRNPAEVARLAGRMAEHIPIGDPVRRFVSVRNPVAPGADDAIERLAGGDQLGPRPGGDNNVDQRVHRRIGDAGQILRAPGGGGHR